MDDDARLVRIEAKVDKLSEAMVEIVRLEASQASVSKRVDRIDTVLDNRIQHKLDDLDARVNRIDSLKSQTEGRSSTIERLFWAFVAAASAWVGYLFSGGGK